MRRLSMAVPNPAETYSQEAVVQTFSSRFLQPQGFLYGFFILLRRPLYNFATLKLPYFKASLFYSFPILQLPYFTASLFYSLATLEPSDFTGPWTPTIPGSYKVSGSTNEKRAYICLIGLSSGC